MGGLSFLSLLPRCAGTSAECTRMGDGLAGLTGAEMGRTEDDDSPRERKAGMARRGGMLTSNAERYHVWLVLVSYRIKRGPHVVWNVIAGMAAIVADAWKERQERQNLPQLG